MAVLRLLLLATMLPASPAQGQRRLDLTGPADAVITEPFTQVAGVRELPGNQALVTDQFERSVSLVNFQTGARRPVGRQGEGPGEYRFPMAPFPGRGDTTWIVDATLRRLHLVTAAGTIPRSVSLPSAGLPGGVAAIRGTDRQGRLYLEGSGFDQGRFLDSVSVVRWDPVGQRSEVVTRVWNGGRVILGGPDGASLARTVTPFPHLDAWTVLPDGQVAVVRHAPFRIDIVELDGRPRAGEPMTHRPIPIAAADREAWRERNSPRRSSALRAGGGSGPPMRGPQFGDEDFPKEMPPFVAATVRATPEGEIWIGRSHTAGARTWHYDLFDAAGRLTGRATLPVGSSVVGFGVATVYVARTDEDDLVHLERFRR
jgi:hypothetical protein